MKNTLFTLFKTFFTKQVKTVFKNSLQGNSLYRAAFRQSF